MSGPNPSEASTCPACGAALRAGAGQCWLCGKAVERSGTHDPPIEPMGDVEFYALAVLILLITCVAAAFAFVVGCSFGVAAFPNDPTARGIITLGDRQAALGIPLGIAAAILVVVGSVWIIMRISRARRKS